jgi:hypothetical protein
MALGSTRPPTEMRKQEYFLVGGGGGKGGRCVGLTTLRSSCADCLEIWQSQPPEPQGPVLVCNGIPLPLPCYVDFQVSSGKFLKMIKTVNSSKSTLDTLWKWKYLKETVLPLSF